MNKENCALKLVDEIILYYAARSKKHQISVTMFLFSLKTAALNHIYRLQFTNKLILTVYKEKK